MDAVGVALQVFLTCLGTIRRFDEMVENKRDIRDLGNEIASLLQRLSSVTGPNIDSSDVTRLLQSLRTNLEKLQSEIEVFLNPKRKFKELSLQLFRGPTDRFYKKFSIILQTYHAEYGSLSSLYLPHILADVNATQTGISNIAATLRELRIDVQSIQAPSTTPRLEPLNTSTSAASSEPKATRDIREMLRDTLGPIQDSQNRIEEIVKELRIQALQSPPPTSNSPSYGFTMNDFSEGFRSSRSHLTEVEVWDVLKQVFQGMLGWVQALGNDGFDKMASNETVEVDPLIQFHRIFSYWTREADISSFTGTKWVLSLEVLLPTPLATSSLFL
jgi:hypothetical protein